MSTEPELSWNQRAFELLAALLLSVDWELEPERKADIRKLVESYPLPPGPAKEGK